MASEEFAEGSRIRRRDPNLYLGLPPLPRLPGRPGMIFPMPDAPAPQEMPPLPVAYSPSNALSTPELLLTEPMLSDWLDALRAGEHAVTFGAPSYHATVSPSLPPPQRVPLECVERLPHPLRVAPAAGGQMISTRELRRSTGGAIEDMTPELRLRRVIQVSQHHNIVRPGLLNHNQRSTSPEAERLVQAIHQSHIALDALRRQKLDGKMGADNKDGNCGCYSSFECNICLEAAKEPIVTQCGHLFCWPCLYQWLHGHSAHSECPVCKGEVLEVNVTPIYGRGGDERDAASNNIPPRPRADRTESLRQQLQISDPRGIASMVRRLMENQDIVRGQAAPPVGGVEVTVFPAATPRARVGIQQRRNLASPLGDTAPESGNQVQLLSSNPDDAAPTDPQQSSSLEQASTSSNVAVIVGQVAQSRRSRPSEFTTTRRTRRRQQE